MIPWGVDTDHRYQPAEIHKQESSYENGEEYPEGQSVNLLSVGCGCKKCGLYRRKKATGLGWLGLVLES